MTGLPPKKNRGGANIHNNIGSPIVIKSLSSNTTDEINSSIEKFINSKSAEEQLRILKSIIEEQKGSVDDGVIQFLAIVFYEAPAKHPVKCFLSRHVTKCTAIQKSFTNFLTTHIVADIEENIQNVCYEYSFYSEKVPKVMMCIENFPCGALAVENVDVGLFIRMFTNYFFECRITLLRESTLTPTKKNEMFNLEHIMLRLIVHVIQKLHMNRDDDSRIPKGMYDVTQCVDILVSDEEVPMDTKSLSGILLLYTECILYTEYLERGLPLSWELLLDRSINILPEAGNNTLDLVIRHKMGRLAVYSAIATTVPMEQLQKHPFFTKTPAVLLLLDQLLTYADGSVSEPAVTVAVTRALLQLSRCLGCVDTEKLGGRIVAALLPFVWTHLEFHLDSVRHLANQILAACLDYCAALDRRGDGSLLESLLKSIRELGEARSFYWAVSHAVLALGASRVLRDLCNVRTLLQAAATPHLQAAASAAISALLGGGACAGSATSEIFECWVRPALGSPPALHAVLPAAIAAHPALLDYIGSNVHGREALACVRAAPACRACLTHRAIRAAAIHKDDETRILALSLVTECGRSTERVSRADLDSVLWFLQYNLNAPRPGLRTALLAHTNKLLKRLEDSHRALSRRGESADHYGPFIEQLRALCFAAALRGASHGRRSAALQLLAATSSVLSTVPRTWKVEHVATLVQHLDDSYDINKATALQVLQHCPIQLLEDCSREMTLSGVLRGAVSLRAAGGAAAAVKLQLMLTRLPHRIVPLPREICTVREEALRPHYALLMKLREQLCRVREFNMWQEAAGGGAPGTLHCLADVLRTTSTADWCCVPWRALAVQLHELCVLTCAGAEPIVAHHAPEGYLPGFPGSAIEVERERVVTTQMVLVCAWRTVKEASAVLGLLAPLGQWYERRLSGEYLVGLLVKAKHRGAVEQAAVGLAAVAHACWLEESSAHFPRIWMRQLLALVGSTAAHFTRRGAGLPAAIQALVSSEVSATGHAVCYNECMAELLRLATADAPGDGSAEGSADGSTDADAVARRTLAANILRALFRHAALEKVSQVHLPAGLRLALQGFEAATWPERTAMSLLFCALSVRVFGVTRARGSELHARNTMPARLFFQRYPGIYDLMLSKLQEFDPGSAAGPGVLPVLLLLARLYPSAVEGAASSLKISTFVPLVQRCACAAELRVRRLAARALPVLLPPSEHMSYIERLFVAISRSDLLHNHWHGALLTLTSLLERATTPNETHGLTSGLHCTPSGSMNALTQAVGPRPCYVIAREYVNILNLLIWKFPEMVPKETLSTVMQYLDDIVFSVGGPPGADRELCLADCTLLYFIILQKEKQVNRILPLINRTLLHPSYEVVLTTLDYLLIQHDPHADIELCHFRRHLLAIRDVTILDNLKQTSEYKTMNSKLSDCLHDVNKYTECRLKSLKLLTLQDSTQMLIVHEKFPTYFTEPNAWLAWKLMHRIEDVHKLSKHMFLESLLKLIIEKFGDLTCLLPIYRVIYDCSSADNSLDSRLAVVTYLATDYGWGMVISDKIQPSEKFEYNALVVSTLVTLLEDDDDVIRQRASDVIMRMPCHTALQDDADDETVDVTVEGASSLATLYRAVRDNAADGVIASASGELLRAYVAKEHGVPLLLVLALLDFHSEVCYTDEITDECKVFDQNERYNIFLEESVWTAACADKIIEINGNELTNLIDEALSMICDRKYSSTFQYLCKENVKLFKKMAKGDFVADETVNPKIEILVRKLRR